MTSKNQLFRTTSLEEQLDFSGKSDSHPESPIKNSSSQPYLSTFSSASLHQTGNQGNRKSEYTVGGKQPPLKRHSANGGNPVPSPQHKRLASGSWGSTGNIFKASPKKGGGPKQIQSHASAQMLVKRPSGTSDAQRPGAGQFRDREEVKLYQKRTNLFSDSSHMKHVTQGNTEFGSNADLMDDVTQITDLRSQKLIELAITDSRPGTTECGYEDEITETRGNSSRALFSAETKTRNLFSAGGHQTNPIHQPLGMLDDNMLQGLTSTEEFPSNSGDTFQDINSMRELRPRKPQQRHSTQPVLPSPAKNQGWKRKFLSKMESLQPSQEEKTTEKQYSDFKVIPPSFRSRNSPGKTPKTSKNMPQQEGFWPSETIVEKCFQPTTIPGPRKLARINTFSQTLQKLSPDKPGAKMNLHMISLKEKTNKKFNQWFKDKDVPEFKVFHEDNTMLRQVCKDGNESPEPKITIQIPDDTQVEDVMSTYTGPSTLGFFKGASTTRNKTFMRINSENFTVNNLQSPIKTNKVIVKTKIKFPQTFKTVEERPYDVTSISSKLQDELLPTPRVLDKRRSQKILMANANLDEVDRNTVMSKYSSNTTRKLFKAKTFGQKEMVDAYKWKLKTFINKENGQNKAFAGNNLHSNPILTTERLYKTVLHTGLTKAMEYVDEKEIGASIYILHALLPICEYAIDLRDCMQLHSLISWVEYTRKNYKKAVDHSDLVVALCGRNEAMSDAKGESLKLIALSKLHMKDYLEAIRANKLCFEHALASNNQIYETEIYEKLSICHFYLGDLEKSKYYKKRHLLGINEPQDSQIRTIYQALRKNFDLRNKGHWKHYSNNGLMEVSDFSWQGENIFELFYKKFLGDCHMKDEVMSLLLKGQFPPERLTTQIGKKSTTMIHKIALALLRRVSKELQKRAKEGKQDEDENQVMELGESWQKTYHLNKVKSDCEDIVLLREKMYYISEENGLRKMMPAEMQHEMDLIAEQLVSEGKIQVNSFGQKKALDVQPVQQVNPNKPPRKLIIPTLGSIYENQIDELPSPDMVHIKKNNGDPDDEGRRKKTPPRKEYSTKELRMICPNLYQFGKKGKTIQNMVDEIELMGKLKDTQDDDKSNFALKMQLKQVRMREKAQLTHLAESRQSRKLRFRTERDKKEYHNRHFKMFEAKLKGQITKLDQESQANLAGGKPTPAQLQTLFDPRKDQLRQIRDAKAILASELPIRAFVYGLDVTLDLLSAQSRGVKLSLKGRGSEREVSGGYIHSKTLQGAKKSLGSCRNLHSSMMSQKMKTPAFFGLNRGPGFLTVEECPISGGKSRASRDLLTGRPSLQTYKSPTKSLARKTIERMTEQKTAGKTRERMTEYSAISRSANKQTESRFKENLEPVSELSYVPSNPKSAQKIGIAIHDQLATANDTFYPAKGRRVGEITESDQNIKEANMYDSTPMKNARSPDRKAEMLFRKSCLSPPRGSALRTPKRLQASPSIRFNLPAEKPDRAKHQQSLQFRIQQLDDQPSDNGYFSPFQSTCMVVKEESEKSEWTYEPSKSRGTRRESSHTGQRDI